jgi:alkylation response protein AidB-like acyl-CoA dehydrogenase
MTPMTLTPEQHEFRRVLRQFCEDKIAPLAAGIDERAEYSWEAFELLKMMELPALQLPVEYGGSGAELVTQAIAAEELARVCASTSLTYLISKLGMLPVLNFGSEDLKRKYVPKIASGEMQASYCLSEADAGSDVAAMKTRAVRDGVSYVISGTKSWITNAGISDLYLIFAKTDPPAWHRGISAFVVERDWGVQVTKLEHKLGVKGSPTGPL